MLCGGVRRASEDPGLSNPARSSAVNDFEAGWVLVQNLNEILVQRNVACVTFLTQSDLLPLGILPATARELRSISSEGGVPDGSPYSLGKLQKLVSMP